jgi:hypothetical protein
MVMKKIYTFMATYRRGEDRGEWLWVESLEKSDCGLSIKVRS